MWNRNYYQYSVDFLMNANWNVLSWLLRILENAYERRQGDDNMIDEGELCKATILKFEFSDTNDFSGIDLEKISVWWIGKGNPLVHFGFRF